MRCASTAMPFSVQEPVQCDLNPDHRGPHRKWCGVSMILMWVDTDSREDADRLANAVVPDAEIT